VSKSSWKRREKALSSGTRSGSGEEERVNP
jgi:hypothetical protein